MSRECSNDFEDIRKYIDGYKISCNLSHAEYVDFLKNMHKCYFSAIAWSAELQHENAKFQQLYPNSNEDIIFRLIETVSDLGSSFFNWINGNYKTSRVMLRVAIENFIRAVSGIEDKSQLVEKSVYKVFDTASKQNLFNGSLNPITKFCFDSLNSDYSTLCADVHTATIQNMERLTSLADFPAFDSKKSNSTADMYIRVAKNVTSIFCLIFNRFFHEIHHRNKENILISVPRKIKPSINSPTVY